MYNVYILGNWSAIAKKENERKILAMSVNKYELLKASGRVCVCAAKKSKKKHQQRSVIKYKTLQIISIYTTVHTKRP